MLRLAWFSPISEKQNLRTSWYTRAVLACAPADWEVELFCSDSEYQEHLALDGATQVCGCSVFPHQRAIIRHRERPFDAFIYQVEDHPRCAFVRSAIELFPGIVFLHDVNLSRLASGEISYATTGEAFDKKLREEFGDDIPKLGDFKARGWSTDIFLQNYPLGLQNLRRASVVVVHNERSIGELKTRGFEIPIELATFPLVQLTPEEVLELRREGRESLGIGENDRVIGFNGQFTLEDRLHLVVRAFFRLFSSGDDYSHSGKKLWLLWVVPTETAEIDARRIVEEASSNNPDLRSQVLITRESDSRSIRRNLACADVIVALKFDVLRGIAPAILHALTLRLPIIASLFGPSGELPTGVVLPIQVGKSEEEELRLAIQELLQNPALSLSLAEASEEYVATVCSPGAVIADIEGVVSAHREMLKAQIGNCDEREAAERERLLTTLRLELGAADQVNRCIADFGWNDISDFDEPSKSYAEV